MSDLNLTSFNPLYPMRIHQYNELINDQNTNVMDKVNSIIDYLNQVGKLTNDVVKDWNTVYNWVMNEGLTTDVNNKLEDMLAKGEFDSIISTIVAEVGDLTTLTTTDKTTIVNAINSLQSDLNTKVGDLTTLQTVDKSSLVHAVNENTTLLAQRATDVKSKGAKGDGVTDDTTAIQNALNSSHSVFFPEGTYLINQPLVIPDGVHIFGAGMPDPSWISNPSGARIKANTNMSAIFLMTSGIQTVRMERLFLDGNGKATRGISIPYLINQVGHFENIYIHNAINEQFYYSGNTGNYVVVRNCILDGGTKGIVIDGADWVTMENVFASNQTAIPFHHISGTHCVGYNCHAYLTVNSVTACFQSDASFSQGEFHLIMPVIENHANAGSGWNVPIGFNAPNQGVHTCQMWRNVTGGGNTGISTVFSSNWSYEGLSQGWSVAENPNGSSTQYDVIHAGTRMWSALPFGSGISRGNIYGSPSSQVVLSQAGTNNPSGGARNGIWCRVPVNTLPAVGNVVTYPITTSALNNDTTQAIIIVPYSGFAVAGQQMGIEARPTETGVTIYVTPYAYPASGAQDLVFLLLFGA